MKNIYPANGLPFWSESEIVEREHFAKVFALYMDEFLRKENAALKESLERRETIRQWLDRSGVESKLDLLIAQDDSIPPSEIHFKHNGRVSGKLVNVIAQDVEHKHALSPLTLHDSGNSHDEFKWCSACRQWIRHVWPIIAQDANETEGE